VVNVGGELCKAMQGELMLGSPFLERLLATKVVLM
jgi:hypothetical protein